MKQTTKLQRKALKPVKRFYKAITSNASKHVITFESIEQMRKTDLTALTDVNGLHYRKLNAFIGTNLQMVIGLKNHVLSYTNVKSVKGNKGSNYPLTFKWPD